MRVIIYSRPDGGVDIIYPSPWAWMPGESDADFLVRIHDRDVPDWALESHIVDSATLPASRRFRDAWQISSFRVAINPGRARGLLLAEVRQERDKLLDDSDKTKHRLDDVGTPEQKANHAIYRQALRDLPARVKRETARLDVLALHAYQVVLPRSDEELEEELEELASPTPRLPLSKKS